MDYVICSISGHCVKRHDESPALWCRYCEQDSCTTVCAGCAENLSPWQQIAAMSTAPAIFGEIWASAYGPEGYEVSNLGNAQSLDRTIMRSNGRPQTWKGKLLCPAPLLQHGRRDRAYRAIDVNRKWRTIGVLILESFVGTRPYPTAVARHLNDNSQDDRLWNLSWGSPQDNAADKRRNGRVPDQRGEANSRAKLTESDVHAIRSAYAAGGVFQRELAVRYCVSRSAIAHIVRGEAWDHI